MKKDIIEIDAARGIFRVTSADERFYAKPSKNPTTGLPEYEFVPSVTWITSYYPKSAALVKWVAKNGWDDAEALKQAAAERGTRVHAAINDLVHGKPILPDSRYDGVEINVDEYAAVLSFRDWFEDVRPEVLGAEYVIWNDEHGYAGTVDLKLKIKGQVWIVDIKTGQSVWPEYELQLSAYKHADSVVERTGVIQVGYKRAKTGFKFTETADKFDLFLATKQIWANETAGARPFQRDYPSKIEIRPLASQLVSPMQPVVRPAKKAVADRG